MLAFSVDNLMRSTKNNATEFQHKSLGIEKRKKSKNSKIKIDY